MTIYLQLISVTTLPPPWLELISAASTKLLAGVTAVAGCVSMVIVTSPVDLIICEREESTTGAVVGVPKDWIDIEESQIQCLQYLRLVITSLVVAQDCVLRSQKLHFYYLLQKLFELHEPWLM